MLLLKERRLVRSLFLVYDSLSWVTDLWHLLSREMHSTHRIPSANKPSFLLHLKGSHDLRIWKQRSKGLLAPNEFVFLDQSCLIEFSGMWEMFYICIVWYSSHEPHVAMSTWKVACATEELNFVFNLNSGTALDSMLSVFTDCLRNLEVRNGSTSACLEVREQQSTHVDRE